MDRPLPTTAPMYPNLVYVVQITALRTPGLLSRTRPWFETATVPTQVASTLAGHRQSVSAPPDQHFATSEVPLWPWPSQQVLAAPPPGWTPIESGFSAWRARCPASMQSEACCRPWRYWSTSCHTPGPPTKLPNVTHRIAPQSITVIRIGAAHSGCQWQIPARSTDSTKSHAATVNTAKPSEVKKKQPRTMHAHRTTCKLLPDNVMRQAALQTWPGFAGKSWPTRHYQSLHDTGPSKIISTCTSLLCCTHTTRCAPSRSSYETPTSGLVLYQRHCSWPHILPHNSDTDLGTNLRRPVSCLPSKSVSPPLLKLCRINA
jgi:hypothetical protein